MRLQSSDVLYRGAMVLYLMVMVVFFLMYMFFFFNDTATTEIYTLSLHDALPISGDDDPGDAHRERLGEGVLDRDAVRSEEHTSELQSRLHLVCRLLLEKKKQKRERVPSASLF